MGCKNWSDFSECAIRRWGITKLANDPNVSISESMVASHHESVGQHWKYITNNACSEMSWLKAMGLLIFEYYIHCVNTKR